MEPGMRLLPRCEAACFDERGMGGWRIWIKNRNGGFSLMAIQEKGDGMSKGKIKKNSGIMPESVAAIMHRIYAAALI